MAPPIASSRRTGWARETVAVARILVAEDDRPLAQLLMANLEQDGHEVVVAEDGRYVLGTLMEQTFDVVVLDLMMPWVDGFEVLLNLGSARPRVVVLTARDDGYSERRARALGVDAYLTKPYDPEDLAATVKRLASDDG